VPDSCCLFRVQALTPLRMWAHWPLVWDKRYAPFIAWAGFISLARLAMNGLPPMDASLITTMVDRWRLETHTFHLLLGELTLTLQDVAHILGLPIDGPAIYEIVDGQGWHDQAEQLLGFGRRSPRRTRRTRRAQVSPRAGFETIFRGAQPVHPRKWWSGTLGPGCGT